jgi:tocopherol O-methyltransferase
VTSASSRDPVATHYDALDRWYRALWGEHLHHGIWRANTRDRQEASEELLRTLATAAQLGPSVRACDVGCGYGGPARWLVANTGAAVLGITNSPKQAAFAREISNDPRVEIRLSDWRANGLPDEAFDAVLAIESLAHFDDPAAAICEMVRVAKPGGRIVIATWITAKGPSRRANRWLLNPIRHTGESPGLANEAAYRKWLTEAGAMEVSTERLGPQVGRTWSSAMLCAVKTLFTDHALLRDAVRHPVRAWRLAASAARIWLGYRFGVLDYAIFTYVR